MQRLSRISGTTGGTLSTTQVAESYQVRWSHYEIIINIRLFLDFPDSEQLRWEKVYKINEKFIAGNQMKPDKPPMEVTKVKQNPLDWAPRNVNLGTFGHLIDLCSGNVKIFNFKSQVGFMVNSVISTQH